MRLRVSLHINPSIYSCYRSSVVSRGDIAGRKTAGLDLLLEANDDHVTARVSRLPSREASLGESPFYASSFTGIRTPRTPGGVALHCKHKSVATSCHAVLTTPLVLINSTKDLHITMPSATCKCPIATCAMILN